MRISWMELSQLAVSVAAAFAFDRYQAAVEPLPTPQSWLLAMLIVGVGAAWVFTLITVRLRDWLQRLRSSPPARWKEHSAPAKRRVE